MIEKYYVWKNNDRICHDGFFEYEDAFEYALKNKADEIEKAIWNNKEAYNNYEPADDFVVVWEKDK